jgi:hypothetical protein
VLFTLTATAQQKQSTKSVTKIEPLPRDLEIQLALSALPPHLKDKATAYVLNPDKGFEVARKGTHGFRACARSINCRACRQRQVNELLSTSCDSVRGLGAVF